MSVFLCSLMLNLITIRTLVFLIPSQPIFLASMTLVTEFRPVAHEFYPEDYHGAAFVGAKAADALWFYRFDASYIEVRDVFTCQDKVFASLSTSDIKQRFKNLLRGEEVIGS